MLILYDLLWNGSSQQQSMLDFRLKFDMWETFGQVSKFELSYFYRFGVLCILPPLLLDLVIYRYHLSYHLENIGSVIIDL
jgi:hypothetical protein